MHIGLIGGIGPAATELYYRALVRSHAAQGKRLTLTIVNADLREMVVNLDAGNTLAQARIFAAYIDQLKRGGCEAVALTSMGGHFCIDDLLTLSSLPLINAVKALDAYFAAAGFKTVGVLGTRAVMDSGLYGLSSARVIAPRPDVRPMVHSQYSAIAMAGAATDEQRAFFEQEALHLFQNDGADVVVLGGTDLFLAFNKESYEYPIADCALIHAEAIARVSMEAEAP